MRQSARCWHVRQPWIDRPQGFFAWWGRVAAGW